MAQRVGELVLTHRPWNERRSCLGGSSGVSVQRLRPVRDLRAPISKRRLTHDDLELGWHGTALVARWPSALLSEWGALVEAGCTTAPAFAVTSREILFSGNFDLHAFHPNYDVAPDGRHFVMITSGNAEPQVMVVTNWLEELRQRLGKR
jgi:hypothetical protein